MYFISRIIISFEQKEKKCLQKKKPLSQKTFALKESSLKEFGYEESIQPLLPQIRKTLPKQNWKCKVDIIKN